MDLILWRHAEAEPGEPDADRRLTAKGGKQAARMAAWLERHLPDGCRVIASPAVRTQQTARALGRSFRTLAALAPGAEPQALLDAAGWPAGRGAVVVVGHQPTLGAAAALALSGIAQPWSVRKGAVWWLSDRQRGEAGTVVLRAVIGPDFA